VLRTLAGRAWVDVEIKRVGDPADVIAAITRSGMRDSVLVTSFDRDLVKWVARCGAGVVTGLLSQSLDHDPVIELERTGAAGYLPDHELIDEVLVRRLHDAGAFVLPWTVDDEETIMRLARWGVDGICSNDVAALVRLLS
jgi:glycerophosphoryl diester phosphodiesterase